MRELCGRRVSLLPVVRRAPTAEARRVLPRASGRRGDGAPRLAVPPRRPRGAARPLQHLELRTGGGRRLDRRRRGCASRTIPARHRARTAKRVPRDPGPRRGNQVLRRLLAPGDRVPDATVWLAPREPSTISELVDDGPALFLFILFAWSST